METPEPTAAGTAPSRGVDLSLPLGTRSRGRPWWVVVGAVFFALLLAGVYEVDLHLPRKDAPATAAPSILVPAGTIDSFPAGQFNAVTFIAHALVLVNGSITTTLGITVYAMSSTQFASFVRTTTLVAGYNWTSGILAPNSVDQVHIKLQTGSWDIVFANPSDEFSTMVGYVSDLNLTSG